MRELAGLPRARRRQLCQLLLAQQGAKILEFNKTAAYDELVIETTPLWRPRQIRVRIAVREIEQGDVDRLSSRMGEAGDAEGLMLAPFGAANDLKVAPTIALIPPEELVARVERSPWVGWVDGLPLPAYERVDALRGLEEDAALLDPIGFRWLPVLALNELPLELAATSVAPQDLLERVAFRVFTQTLRFGGKRHGEAARGQRLADSVLTWIDQSGTRTAALLDCKAAASGYTMEADHLLRFERYVDDARPVLESEGQDLRFVIVLSSSFRGRSGARHPFHARSRELRDRSGVELTYVTAIDLARLAVTVEARELDPDVRAGIDWSDVFSRGLVTTEDLELRNLGVA